MANPVLVAALEHIFIILGALYGVLFIIPAVQLVRIHLTSFPIKRITTQKTFLFLLMLTSLSFTDTDTTFNLGKFDVEAFTILDDLGW
eukprot:gene9327-11438_t